METAVEVGRDIDNAVCLLLAYKVTSLVKVSGVTGDADIGRSIIQTEEMTA